MTGLFDEVLSSHLADARLTSIAWDKVGNDLVIEFEPPAAPGAEPTPVRLRFVWVHDLRLHWDFGQFMGKPLLNEAIASKLAGGAWSIAFTFSAAPEGEISFECNEWQIVDRA